jgi:hypothetical protein
MANMSDNLKRRFMAIVYALAMVLMGASLTFEVLRPKAYANSCPNTGQPCNISTTGGYACTGGINGGPPIPGCACDLGNFCTGD